MIHIFLVNPTAGSQAFSEDLRTALDSMDGLQYYIFNSRFSGDESEIIRRTLDIFDEEQIRFYICGGNGTFCNALNGFSDISSVEIAFFPCGFGNDFLQSFGEDEKRFHDIRELVNGDVIDVDYIKTNHGICLNAVSLGIDVTVIRILQRLSFFSFFGRSLASLVSAVVACFWCKPKNVDLYIDDRRVTGKYSEVFFGNGFRLGGKMYLDNDADIDDGKALVSLIPPKRGFALLEYLLLICRKQIKEFRELSEYSYAKEMRIVSRDGENLAVSMDGIEYSNEKEWKMEIVTRGLHLVVPKGVRP